MDAQIPGNSVISCFGSTMLSKTSYPMTSGIGVSTNRYLTDGQFLACSCVTSSCCGDTSGDPSDLLPFIPLVHQHRAPTLPSMDTPTAMEAKYLSMECSQWTPVDPRDLQSQPSQSQVAETKTPTVLNQRRTAELFRSCYELRTHKTTLLPSEILKHSICETYTFR